MRIKKCMIKTSAILLLFTITGCGTSDDMKSIENSENKIETHATELEEACTDIESETETKKELPYSILSINACGGDLFLDEEENYFSKAVCEINHFDFSNIWGTYLIDLDRDGEQEGIVLSGKDLDFDAFLWYVSETGEVTEFPNIGRIDCPENMNASYLEMENETYFICNIPFAIAETAGVVFTEKNGQLCEIDFCDDTYFNTKSVNQYNELVCIDDFYGGSVELDSLDSYSESDFWVGHCWIPYPFYYNEEKGQFVEYRALEVSNLDEIVPENKYQYDFEIEELTKDFASLKYIYRENGEIDIVCTAVESNVLSFQTIVLRIDEQTKEVHYDNTYYGYMSPSFFEREMPVDLPLN